MTIVKVAKYHGCGNDFVIIDSQELSRILPVQEHANFAKHVCDRHFGIGADGLLVVGQPDRSEELGNVSMQIFNPDGSVAEMCGNGIRCVADYAMKRGWTKGLQFTIDTDAGPKQIEIVRHAYRVNMGLPEFDPKKIPVDAHKVVDGIPEVALEVRGVGHAVYASCVSMGNPHAVVACNVLGDIPVGVWGPQIEESIFFPEKTNVEFAHIFGRNTVKVRVWERGVGETLACGTGACAVAAVGVRVGALQSPVEVELPGGTLTIEWDGEGDIYMRGPATQVANMEYDYKGGRGS